MIDNVSVTSAYMGSHERAVLNRIGDIMIPAYEDFPAFSTLGCIDHIDGVVKHAPPEDIAQLQAFLKVLYFMPTAMLRLVVWLTQHADGFPEPVATNLRLLDMGLRSIVLTLYYSGKAGVDYDGKTPLALMGYELNALRRSETASR